MNLSLIYTYWQQYDSYSSYIRKSLKVGTYYFISKMMDNKWYFYYLSSYHVFSSLDDAKLNADKIIINNNKLVHLLDEKQSQKYLILL